MKNPIKKVVTLVAALAAAMIMPLYFTGCGDADVTEVVKVGALNGPTGMGMVQLMNQTDRYDVKTFESPDELTGKIISGELDVATVPSNVAAVLYNKTHGKITAISPVTLGVLYLLENGTENVKTAEDLAGKTIYASGKGSTPEYILQIVLEDAGMKMSDVKVKWLSNHSDAQQSFLKKKGSLALLPEPFVTITETKVKTVKTALDMNRLWKEATGYDLSMSILVAQKSFAEERIGDIDILIDDYDTSVKFVNENPAEAAKKIAEWGFIADEKIAEKAIPNCNIVFFSDATESREIIETFNETLYEMNPKAVGGTLPGDDFYRK